MLAKLHDLGPSIIRTVTPWVVGAVVTLLARWGVDWTPTPEALVVATGLVSAAYYALVRILETRGRQAWGWLLGVPKAPVYPQTPKGEGGQGAVDLLVGVLVVVVLVLLILRLA